MPLKKSKRVESINEFLERQATDGVVVPQAIGVEQSVLGSMLIDRACVAKVMGILGGTKTEDDSYFYRMSHWIIYETMLALESKSIPIDLVSVTNRLREKGKLELIGGPAYLVELTSNCITTANVESHARIIIEKYILRKIAFVGSELVLKVFANECDINEMVDSAESAIFNLRSKNEEVLVEEAPAVATRAIELAKQIKDNSVVGVPSGLCVLDELTNGSKPGRLYFIGAATGGGKSALAVTLCVNAMFGAKPTGVIVFTMEMMNEEYIYRVLANMAGVSYQELENNKIMPSEWGSVNDAAKDLKDGTLLLCDAGDLTPMKIRAKLRRHAGRYGLVIIDYIQLIALAEKTQTTEEKFSIISRSLKMMAKEFKVPIMVLAQLNREGTKDNKRPTARDFKYASSFEQDADNIYFIWDPALSNDDVARVNFIIEKQRGGPKGMFEVTFNKPTSKFHDVIAELPSATLFNSMPPAKDGGAW